MKKIIALLLATIMVFSFSACGNDETKKENKTDGKANSEQSAFDNGEDVSHLTNEEKVKKAEENVLEYLKAKYGTDGFVVEDIDFSDLDADDAVVQVPVDLTYDSDSIYYYVFTDISKSGEANINFCKDNIESDYSGWMTRIYYEIFEINSRSHIKDWHLEVTPDTYFGIEAKTSGNYNYQDLINVMTALNGKGYKLKANVGYTHFYCLDVEMNEDQKAFFDGFEEIIFYDYDDNTIQYRYDKSKGEFVEK